MTQRWMAACQQARRGPEAPAEGPRGCQQGAERPARLWWGSAPSLRWGPQIAASRRHTRSWEEAAAAAKRAQQGEADASACDLRIRPSQMQAQAPAPDQPESQGRQAPLTQCGSLRWLTSTHFARPRYPAPPSATLASVHCMSPRRPPMQLQLTGIAWGEHPLTKSPRRVRLPHGRPRFQALPPVVGQRRDRLTSSVGLLLQRGGVPPQALAGRWSGFQPTAGAATVVSEQESSSVPAQEVFHSGRAAAAAPAPAASFCLETTTLPLSFAALHTLASTRSACSVRWTAARTQEAVANTNMAARRSEASSELVLMLITIVLSVGLLGMACTHALAAQPAGSTSLPNNNAASSHARSLVS